MGTTKKTLVIHPNDRTTDFLTCIYDGINNKSVYREGLSKKEIIQKIIQITGLDHHSIIADIGSGTGKLTEPFLEIAKRIYAVDFTPAIGCGCWLPGSC